MKRLLLPLLLVAGCGWLPIKPVEAPAMRPEEPCGANAFRQVVGKQIGNVTVPADRTVRVIGPDTAVTMDYRPNRLNFDVDGQGRVLRVHCS